MNSVIISITGTQKDSSGEENSIELVTVGKFYQKNDIQFIIYDESAISGLEGTQTVLKIYPAEVVLLRNGQVRQRQVFRPGAYHSGVYTTIYGQLEMAIQTTSMEVNVCHGVGSILIAYELFVDGQWQSSNTLSISIREEKKK